MSKQMQIQGVAGLLSGEIAVDLFAGGGGASTGIEWALGISPALAVNHDPLAIAMHAANHPDAEHRCESVFDVSPTEACRGRRVGLLWASPDCTHFSRAKGGKPRSQKIRGLAWVVVDWAAAVAPRVIALENVPEFVTWGPLDDQGQPIATRVGETFAEFKAQLRALGYEVDHRVLNAADYGAPTSRRRLFLVARRDGVAIRWPEATHGPGRALPYRTAAECIDWSLTVPSIFERKRPLAEATLRRIAEGIRRYVLEDPRPFIVPVKSWGGGGNGPRSIDEPMRTTTASKRGEHALVAPTLIQTSYGERKGQAPRALDLHKPLGTVVAGGQKHGLVACMLKHYGGVVGQRLDRPAGTITSQDHHAVLAAHVTKFQENSVGQDAREPLHTVMAGAARFGVVAAFLLKYYSTGGQWQKPDSPLATVVAKARHGLVTVDLEGEPYVIADIGMRMLQPRELARAQGFPDSYVLTGTKTQQVARIGNSVCPHVAQAVVAAQLVVDAPTRRRRKAEAA